MTHLAVPGATIYYETAGRADKPALLLVHSGIATLRMWDPQIDALAAEHFVIRYDTRGFGRTRASAAAFSDRADALAILDRLRVQAATVVGCSRGGGIAIDLALEFPDRVRGLVVISGGPSGFPESEQTPLERQLFQAVREAEAAEEWELLSRLEAELWAIGPRRTASELDPAFVKTAYALSAENVQHAEEMLEPVPLQPPAYGRLGDIRVPTLLVVGDEDISGVLDQFEYLRDHIRAAESTVMMNTAHLPSVERPVEFESLLIDWLARHSR